MNVSLNLQSLPSLSACHEVWSYIDRRPTHNQLEHCSEATQIF